MIRKTEADALDVRICTGLRRKAGEQAGCGVQSAERRKKGNRKRAWFRALLLAGLIVAFAEGSVPVLAMEKTEEVEMPEPEPDSEEETETEEWETVGEFQTQDILDNEYTQKVFEEYDLTLVNVFATWCSPCIAELPELAKLYKELREEGIGVVGIVIDSVDADGEQDKEAIAFAQLLAEAAEAHFPMLLPDETQLNGRIADIQAVPESFFVDSNGRIVGETYIGSRNLEAWKEIVENERIALGLDKNAETK